MKEYVLSPSALKFMADCPRCFWLYYNTGRKRPKGIFSSIPNRIHDMLTDHFDFHRNLGRLPPEICENEYCKDTRLFSDISLLTDWRSSFKGISYSKNGYQLRGAIDEVLVKDDKLIVLDFKTTGSEKSVKRDKNQNQLDIYNFLFRKNNYKTEDYGFLLYYFPKTITGSGNFIFESRLIKMETNVENAETSWKNSLTLLNGKIPEKKCEWCERY